MRILCRPLQVKTPWLKSFRSSNAISIPFKTGVRAAKRYIEAYVRFHRLVRLTIFRRAFLNQLPELQALDMYVIDVQKICIEFMPAVILHRVISRILRNYFAQQKEIFNLSYRRANYFSCNCHGPYPKPLKSESFLTSATCGLKHFASFRMIKCQKKANCPVFLSAALTIVCASGEDVHAGLKPHGTTIKLIQGLQFSLS